METWVKICRVADIPRLGARVVKSARGDIAVFRTANDEIFALMDRCPHKAGPLSQGIVHGKRVTCPLHNWVLELADGNALAPDVGCAPTVGAKIDEEDVYLDMPAARTTPVAAE